MTGPAFTDEVDWKFSGCPGSVMLIRGYLTYPSGATVQKDLFKHFGDPLSQHPGNTMSPTALLTFGERVGLILLAETSAVSASAILGLLSYIAVCSVRHRPPKV